MQGFGAKLAVRLENEGGEVGRGVSEAFLVLSSFGSVGGSVGGVVSGSRGGHGIGNGDIDIGGVEIVSVNNV